MITEIRSFTLSDRENIIGIFNSNCPKYFDKNDLQDLIDFLDNYADDNFKNVLGNFNQLIFSILMPFRRFAIVPVCQTGLVSFVIFHTFFGISSRSTNVEIIIWRMADFAKFNFPTRSKVLLHNNEVIGCGGHYVKQKDKVFGIAWVMFRRFSIGQINFLKITTQFFNHILTNIEKEKLDFDIVINTTQLLEKTFNKFGFWTETIIEKGFGENLDHYIMRPGLSYKNH